VGYLCRGEWATFAGVSGLPLQVRELYLVSELATFAGVSGLPLQVRELYPVALL